MRNAGRGHDATVRRPETRPRSHRARPGGDDREADRDDDAERGRRARVSFTVGQIWLPMTSMTRRCST